MPALPEGLHPVVESLRARVGAGAEPPTISAPTEIRAQEQTTQVVRVAFPSRSSAPSRFYCKFYNQQVLGVETARQRACNEFEALELLQRHLHDLAPRISVPLPVLHVPEYACFVMTECSGVTFHWLIRRQAGLRARWRQPDLAPLERPIQLYAEWLERLQTLVQRRNLTYPTDALSASFQQHVEFCRREGYVTVEVSDRLSRVREKLIGYMTGCHYDEVGTQRDASPQNMLVSAQGISLIDFTQFGYRHPYRDICDFWRALRPVNPLVDRRVVSHLQEFFLAQVRRRFAIDETILAFFMVSSTLEDAYNTASFTAEARGMRLASKLLFQSSFRSRLEEAAGLAERITMR